MKHIVDTLMDWKKFQILVNPEEVHTVMKAVMEIEKRSLFLENRNIHIPNRDQLLQFRYDTLLALQQKGLMWYTTHIYNPLALANGHYTVKPKKAEETNVTSEAGETPGLQDFLERTPKATKKRETTFHRVSSSGTTEAETK